MPNSCLNCRYCYVNMKWYYCLVKENIVIARNFITICHCWKEIRRKTLSRFYIEKMLKKCLLI